MGKVRVKKKNNQKDYLNKEQHQSYYIISKILKDHNYCSTDIINIPRELISAIYTEKGLDQFLFKKGSFSGRYDEELRILLYLLGAKKVLREEYENNYQGFIDVDVLLKNGKVFSYYYPYGSCAGCDEWESRNLEWFEIIEEMYTHATIFDNMEQYKQWRKNVEQQKGE